MNTARVRHPPENSRHKIDAHLRGVLTHTRRIDTSGTMYPCVTETHLLTCRRRRQSANASRRFPTAFLKGCQKTVLGVLSVGRSAFGLRVFRIQQAPQPSHGTPPTVTACLRSTIREVIGRLRVCGASSRSFHRAREQTLHVRKEFDESSLSSQPARDQYMYRRNLRHQH